MSETNGELLVDVRALALRARHPNIMAAWQEIRNGEALLLVSNEDPVRLYFQFACEFAGRFRWDYLEDGPAVWRVRILKGECLDPGFVPTRQLRPTAPGDNGNGNGTTSKALVLDTRPIFHRGESPCSAIDEAVGQLAPAQPLVLLVPFEPMPLYAKLRSQGFSHSSTQSDDGTWRIEFKKTAAAT